MKSEFEEEVCRLINDYLPVNADPLSRSPAMDSFNLPRAMAPVKATMKAVIVGSRDVYCRPLCTSGDVLVALHELADPALTVSGCVQLPHVMRGPIARDSSGYYRAEYLLNKPFSIAYLRYGHCGVHLSIMEFLIDCHGADQNPLWTMIADLQSTQCIFQRFGRLCIGMSVDLI